MSDDDVTRGLDCTTTKTGIEVGDRNLGSWVIRLSPTTATSARRGPVGPSVAAVSSLAQALTPVGAVITSAASAGQSLQVSFSTAAQAAIRTGELSLMTSSTGSLPMAVDATGRVREIARMVPPAGIAAPALLPVLLPAAAAAAASYYQHQVLQATLDGIREVVDRIEERLRDDDWAILETGDDLTVAMLDVDAGRDVPSQLRMELAVARQAVERVFRSRRRFARQLASKINDDTTGRPDPWTDQVRKLVKGDHNWLEISIYLQAMLVRARLTAATAFVLAADGDAQASALMTASAVSELEDSYAPLLAALEPLAGRRPDEKLRDRIPGRRASDEERFRFLGSLVGEMREGIGKALDAGKADTKLTIPAHLVKAIDATLRA